MLEKHQLWDQFKGVMGVEDTFSILSRNSPNFYTQNAYSLRNN